MREDSVVNFIRIIKGDFYFYLFIIFISGNGISARILIGSLRK